MDLTTFYETRLVEIALAKEITAVIATVVTKTQGTNGARENSGYVKKENKPTSQP